MELESIIRLCRSFENADLSYWIDGGWGVDALLGRQTRPHSDLDLAVRRSDLKLFQQVLEEHGFRRADRAGDPDWNWVLVHPCGESVDLHGFVFDQHGNGILGDPKDNAMYPVGALAGVGSLGNTTVNCIAAPFVLSFRSGFTPREVDHHDVSMLCAEFGLAVPSCFHREGSFRRGST